MLAMFAGVALLVPITGCPSEKKKEPDKPAADSTKDKDKDKDKTK
jgi:hypothetical protein